jgi:hypothetical protein
VSNADKENQQIDNRKNAGQLAFTRVNIDYS